MAHEHVCACDISSREECLSLHNCLCLQIVMDWLGKLLGLPQQFLSRDSKGELQAGGGVIQGTASEAALVCMLAARARAMQDRPVTDMAKLVAYTSDQVRSAAALCLATKPLLACLWRLRRGDQQHCDQDMPKLVASPSEVFSSSTLSHTWFTANLEAAQG